MSKLTQKAIKTSFVKLLDRKPIDHITIKDITDDCGISRNTFYYHYSDVPTLLEEILNDSTDEIIRRYPTIDSLEECLKVATEFVLENRRAAAHIYNSSHRHIYERCIMKVCRRATASYFDIAIPEEVLSGRDRELMIDYYKCFSFGLVIDWCDNGMKETGIGSFSELLNIRRRLGGFELDF